MYISDNYKLLVRKAIMKVEILPWNRERNNLVCEHLKKCGEFTIASPLARSYTMHVQLTHIKLYLNAINTYQCEQNSKIASFPVV